MWSQLSGNPVSVSDYVLRRIASKLGDLELRNLKMPRGSPPVPVTHRRAVDHLKINCDIGTRCDRTRQTLIGAASYCIVRRPDRATAVRQRGSHVRHPRGELPVLRGATRRFRKAAFLVAFIVPLLLAPERIRPLATPVQPART